ncbi:MAG: Holliday junction resolvase RuvX [Actinobacteria bacterium]|nr:Holliday junction resolvase RuvX [Actinomycetota bacterium]
MRSLGLDIGNRRIGVAISDPLGLNATPLEVLNDMDAAALRAYVEEKVQQGVKAVVIGLPLTMGGREGEQARITREYARSIQDIGEVRVVLWDERLSTVEAKRRLREAGRSLRGRKVDAEAAAVILQAFLEHHAHDNAGEERDGC